MFINVVKQMKKNLQKIYHPLSSHHLILYLRCAQSQKRPKNGQKKLIFERRLESFVGLSCYIYHIYHKNGTSVLNLLAAGKFLMFQYYFQLSLDIVLVMADFYRIFQRFLHCSGLGNFP